MDPFCEQTFKLPNSLKKSGRGLASSRLSRLPIVKISDAEQAFLVPAEYGYLTSARVDALSPGQRMTAQTSQATGICSSEAKNLAGAQITPYRITCKKTKNGKVSSIPISKELYQEIPKKSGRLFTPYLCQPLYDEGWRHTRFKGDTRSLRYKNDDDLCTFCAYTP